LRRLKASAPMAGGIARKEASTPPSETSVSIARKRSAPPRLLRLCAPADRPSIERSTGRVADARQSRPLGGEGDGGPHNSTCGPSPYRLVTTPPFCQPCGPQLVGTALVAVTPGGQPTDCCVAEVLAQPPHSASEKSNGSRRLGMNVVPRKHGSQMVWQPQDSERQGGSLSCPATKCDRKKKAGLGRGPARSRTAGGLRPPSGQTTVPPGANRSPDGMASRQHRANRGRARTGSGRGSASF
jgi:hypothetical protein